MKVLQINATYGFGSTGKIVQEIDELAQKNQIQSFVAAPKLNGKKDNAFCIGTWLGRKLHALFSRIGGKQAFYSKFATKRLILYIKKLNPDIVHLHNLHSNYVHLPLLLRYLGKTNKKIVITQHDCWFFTGKCFHYSLNGCKKWQLGCGECPKKLEDTPAYLKDDTAKAWIAKKEAWGKIKDLTVVCVSDWLKKETEKSFLKGRDLRVIKNGVDLSIFKPQESDFLKQNGIEDKFVVLGMANKWLLPINNSRVEKIYELLPKDCVVVLVGCEMNQLKPERKNEIRLGRVSPIELAKLYSMADVFVNLSKEDSLPTVNLECVACGTPIIAQNVTGIGETIDENTGILLEDGKSENIAKAIAEIRNKGKEFYKKGCLEKAKRAFNKELSYKKYIELYRELLR